MVASWLVGSAVTGGFIFANLRVNRDDRLKAANKEELAKSEARAAASRVEATERTLESTREQLAKAQADANDARELATKAETASKPKPLNERLVSLLRSIDPKFIAGLQSGYREFSGDMKPWEFSELQKICAEPGSAAYIKMKVGETSKLTTDGLLTPVHITIIKSPLP